MFSSVGTLYKKIERRAKALLPTLKQILKTKPKIEMKDKLYQKKAWQSIEDKIPNQEKMGMKC
jgi:hypothetical protein